MAQQAETEDQQFSQFINSIKNGSLEQVEDILHSSSPTIVNRIEPQFREPSLYFAALVPGDEQSAELIKLLIRNGANANFKDHNQQTILFYICREGKEKCAELLLSHGLSLDDIDVYGQTPMFYAVSENRLGIVSRYATRQRVNHVDKLARQTPLYYAARRGHLQMAALLIEKGADVTVTDSSNKTVVDYAKKAKFFDVADFLGNQLKKYRDVKPSSEEPERKAGGRRKEEPLKDSKSVYKIVRYNEKGESQDLTEEEVRQLLADRPQLARYMANPELIPQEAITELQAQSWEKAAMKVLNQCCKLKGAYYFLEPVDPVKFSILDYFDIITQPMDLGTVRKRLTHNFYSEASEFVRDMNLIWNNSYRYNGEHHVVSKCGKELQNNFNELVVSQGLNQYLTSRNNQNQAAYQEGQVQENRDDPNGLADVDNYNSDNLE